MLNRCRHIKRPYIFFLSAFAAVSRIIKVKTSKKKVPPKTKLEGFWSFWRSTDPSYKPNPKVNSLFSAWDERKRSLHYTPLWSASWDSKGGGGMKDFCRHLIGTTPHIICSNVTTSSTIFSFSIPDFYSRVYVTGSNDHPRFVHVSFDCVSLLSFYGQQQLLTFFLNPLAEVLKIFRFSSHFV